MKKIQARKIQILKYIVEEYLQSGAVTGSKSLQKKHELPVSSATIRSDMASLETMGLIFQPYNSAGRLPTARGLRVFVDYLMEEMPHIFVEAETRLEDRNQRMRIDDTLYDIVARLTKATGEISFATIPETGTNYYLGLANFLERSTGSIVGEEVYRIIRILEDKHHFTDLLASLDIGPRGGVFIGEENIIPDLESCTMIVKRFELAGHHGYLGLLGPMKMDYAYNISAIRQVL
jgi:transcriptional regulator of heat shock response